MSDDTSAALERLREMASLGRIDAETMIAPMDARAILAHIAALEARAENAEAARLNVEGRWLTAEAGRREALLRTEWAEAFGHVFHTLPDGRLDFVAVREGSPLGELHRRAEAAEAREAELRAALEKIADEQKVYLGHGDYTIEPAYSAEEAQGMARQALPAAPATPASRESRERVLELLREIKRDYSLAVSTYQYKKAEAPHWAARLAAQQQIEGAMRMIARIDAALARQMGGGDAE